MTPLPLPSAGDTIGGKYVLGRTLGEGGMGVVFEATHKQLGHRCALKLLRPEIASNDEAVARFDREARAAASLTSRHVCRVSDVGAREDGTPFMVMEYLEGETLGAVVDRGEVLPLEEVVRLMLEACEAMEEAHARRIIHRDLKPENLFLAREGARTSIKLLDFGISKHSEEESVSVTRTQSSIGTPLYMSPEQTRSTKHVDARTDIWSLGVILYELLAGQVPFLGDSPTQVAVSVALDKHLPVRSYRPELPETIEAVVATALAKDPDDRFQSIRSFAAALTPFASPNLDTSRWLKSDGLPPAPISRRSISEGTQALETATTLNVHAKAGPPRAAAKWPLIAGLLVAVGGIGVIALLWGKPQSPEKEASTVASERSSGVGKASGDVGSQRPTAEISPATNASTEPSVSPVVSVKPSAGSTAKPAKPSATPAPASAKAPPPLTAAPLPTRL